MADHNPSAHVKGSYPYHGYWWIATNAGNATLYLTSDRCKAKELKVRDKFNYQLRGQDGGRAGPFAQRWPTGIDLFRYQPNPSGCRVYGIDPASDIHLDWMTSSEWTSSGHGNCGGHSHSWRDSTRCAQFGTSSPCGYAHTRIHLNEPRYANYSGAYKRKFLLHESGHPMGFRDYCGHDSVSNSGAGCPILKGYFNVDRKMLRTAIY